MHSPGDFAHDQLAGRGAQNQPPRRRRRSGRSAGGHDHPVGQRGRCAALERRREDVVAQAHLLRLALLGIQATIQTTTLPDRGVWHRVRIGPYTRVEELNRARDTLKQNGVETTLIKVRE